MQLSKLLPKTKDFWEEKADKVLSHFNYKYPDEIDLYDICWRYGMKIKPLDKHFSPELFENDLVGDETEAFSIPQNKGKRGLIYLYPDLDPVKKKILLAEEFSHLYAHHINQLTSGCATLLKTENQAKRMSAYLLMPKRFLKDIYVAAADQAVLVSDIADHFVVTEEFAHYRLELAFSHRVDAFATIKGQLGTIELFET